VYAVVPGDNLWVFTEKYLGGQDKLKELQRLNNISNPRRLRPGMLIGVPMAWIPASVPVSAVVQAVQGTVRISRGGGDKVAAQVDAELWLGDSIRTGKSSSVAIRFADDSILTLLEASELRFDRLSAYGKTCMVDSSMDLLNGRLDTRVKPAVGPGSRFEIETPSAISAVRGTEYRASSDPTMAAVIEVLEGSVSVIGASQELLLPHGYGTRVVQNQAPTPARKLLPPPEVQKTLYGFVGRPFVLAWPEVAGASAYRVEVSQTPDFATVSWQRLVPTNSLEIGGLELGDTFVRLRAADELGFEGFSTVSRLSVADPPPVKVDMPSVTIFKNDDGSANLRWGAVKSNEYQVQISGTADFQSLDADVQVDGGEFAIKANTSRARYLRVRTIDPNGNLSPWSDTLRVEVAPRDGSWWPVIVTFLLIIGL